MDLKPCPFCGGKAKQVDICATDFSSANAGGSYIICQSCLACSAVMFGEKAGLSELWNCRALPPEPRTCETCGHADEHMHCAPMATCDHGSNWEPKAYLSPVSAEDVETAARALRVLLDAFKRRVAGFPLDHETEVASEEYAQNAVDCIAGKEE